MGGSSSALPPAITQAERQRKIQVKFEKEATARDLRKTAELRERLRSDEPLGDTSVLYMLKASADHEANELKKGGYKNVRIVEHNVRGMKPKAWDRMLSEVGMMHCGYYVVGSNFEEILVGARFTIYELRCDVGNTVTEQAWPAQWPEGGSTTTGEENAIAWAR